MRPDRGCSVFTPVLSSQAVLTAIWMWAYAYYTYPAVLFAILVIGSGASSYLLHQQRLRLVNLATQRHLIPVLYQNFVRALLAKYLVPGDVIVVQRGTAVCDMVLLRGTCLAEESMLSGEVWALATLGLDSKVVGLFGCVIASVLKWIAHSTRCCASHYGPHSHGLVAKHNLCTE